MKPAIAALGCVLGLLVGGSSRAEAPARALTAPDDARACAPLSGGGLAVATGGGLVLIGKDGASRVLTSLDGLPDTRVHTVAESASGLWIGTESGAALVRGGVVVRTVGEAPVHAILAAPDGGVHVGTWGAGVLRLASETALPVLVPSSTPGKHVAAIADHGGAVYVAYADGPLARIDGGTLRPVAGGPTHGQALVSSGGRLLLGDVEGAYRVSPGGAQSFASVDVRGIAVSEGLLLATYGSGLLASTSASDAKLRVERGVPRWVTGVGSLGAVRCAATTEGVFVDAGSGWRRVPLGALPSNDVTTLAALGDRVAVGTFDRGAAIHHDGAFHRIHGLDHDETVNASAWQGEGASARLWLGTAHGLVRVDGAGVVTRRLRAADGLPSSIVRAVLVLSNEQLLVGTEEGAAFVEGDRITPLVAPKKGTRAPLASPMHATWALARSRDGVLFIGTASGLYYGKDGVFARASVSSGELADDWVTALAVTSSQGRTEVFAGSYSGGVTHLSLEDAALSAGAHPVVKQLGGGYVNPDGLTVHGSDLFASTMDGLLVRPLSDDAAAWKARPGATVGRDVTATRFVGSSLWVASRRGIALTTH